MKKIQIIKYTLKYNKYNSYLKLRHNNKLFTEALPELQRPVGQRIEFVGIAVVQTPVECVDQTEVEQIGKAKITFKNVTLTSFYLVSHLPCALRGYSNKR